MTGFSPIAAGTEGLRVMRREPKAFMGWIAIWTVALLVVATLQVVTLSPDTVSTAAKGGMLGLVRRFGPLWPLLVVTLLVLWVMTTATLFRAVLRPDEHGWHLFKLGADEFRLGAITGAALVMLAALGSGPALLLWLLAKPVLTILPEFGRWVVFAGVWGTVAIELWIAVRLSLAPVHTFAEGRFHLVGYWSLTARSFWRLLLSYAVVFLLVLVLLFVVGLVVLLLGGATSALGTPDGADVLRRGGLLALVGVMALLSAIIFVVPLTLVCACQAYAYRAIHESAKGFWS